jgi:hypothetical protein
MALLVYRVAVDLSAVAVDPLEVGQSAADPLEVGQSAVDWLAVDWSEDQSAAGSWEPESAWLEAGSWVGLVYSLRKLVYCLEEVGL